MNGLSENLSSKSCGKMISLATKHFAEQVISTRGGAVAIIIDRSSNKNPAAWVVETTESIVAVIAPRSEVELWAATGRRANARREDALSAVERAHVLSLKITVPSP